MKTKKNIAVYCMSGRTHYTITGENVSSMPEVVHSIAHVNMLLDRIEKELYASNALNQKLKRALQPIKLFLFDFCDDTSQDVSGHELRDAGGEYTIIKYDDSLSGELQVFVAPKNMVKHIKAME